MDKKLQIGVRVTVQKRKGSSSSGKLKGTVVSPVTPRIDSGLYWGYQVRYASAFRKVLFESCFNDRYDLKIAVNNKSLCFEHIEALPAFRHALIVFGGINDIEAAIEADEKLRARNLADVFDLVCEAKRGARNLNAEFGSRSIRLEVSSVSQTCN